MKEFFAIVFLALVVAGMIGYGLNIYKFATANFKEPYVNEIVHGIGFIPIIGAVTGYITIDD